MVIVEITIHFYDAMNDTEALVPISTQNSKKIAQLGIPTRDIPTEVQRCAKLANILLSQAQAEVVEKNFRTMLTMFETIEHYQLSTYSQEPQHVHSIRNDVAQPYSSPELLIGNSEDHEHNYVLLPNLL